ncbi:CopD family protein [Trinickia dabaoshanensis]|nr:CopD family protein [Trinickia dabaoshanensis]
MLYLWLKALHVGAVLVFLAGLAPMALTVAILSKPGTTVQAQALAHAELIDATRRWDRRVTSPALSFVWVLGLALGWMGGWFSAPWLMVKLFFVVVLSALHGMMSARLRRVATGRAATIPGFSRHFPAVIVVSAIAIGLLVILKPFAP